MKKRPASARPDCFGHLDTVFPKTADGLRQSPPACMRCRHKTDCLRSAVQGAAGVEVHEEALQRAYRSGVISFFERWSRKKRLSRRRKQGL